MIKKAIGRPMQICIFSHARTASNLFCKLFSQHPSVIQEKYKFSYAFFFGPEAQLQVVSKEMDELQESYKIFAKDLTYQASLDGIQNLMVETKKAGKFLMLKDHTALLITPKEIQKMLDRPRRDGSEPKMEDKMLDLLGNEREDFVGSAHSNSNAVLLNPTILPDRMVQMFVPVFFIRHPIKQIESWYRASRVFGMRPDESDFELLATYRFSKRLFNYYAKLYQPDGASPVISTDEPRWPVVIDGDDLINDTEGIANRFCELTGLDPRGVIYKWEPEEVSADPIEAAFFGTLKKSGGVKRNEEELKAPDISEASIKWSEKWGPEVGKALVRFVDDLMPDYEYLYQFRFKSGSV